MHGAVGRGLDNLESQLGGGDVARDSCVTEKKPVAVLRAYLAFAGVEVQRRACDHDGGVEGGVEDGVGREGRPPVAERPRGLYPSFMQLVEKCPGQFFKAMVGGVCRGGHCRYTVGQADRHRSLGATMQLRKLLLRIMIWSLAAAAVLGAVAILTSVSTVAWQIAGTTTVTAVCAAAMMAASLLLDKERGRASGLVGMGASLASALLFLILIWDLDDVVPVLRSEETCWLTIAFILTCVFPAMFYLWGRHVPSIRIASNVGVVLTIVTFAALMVPTWDLDNLLGAGLSEEWYESAAATGVLGLLATLCLISINIPRQPKALWVIRILGLATTVLTWGISVYAIWANLHEDNGTLTLLFSIGCMVALINLTLLVPLTSGLRWVRWGTLMTAAIAAVCADILALNKWSGSFDSLSRIGGAAGFMASCGSLALIILARINRPMTQAGREYREAKEVVLVCPGCRTKSTLPVGVSACRVCHLRFSIQVHEPRCTNCDYLLFMLTSDRCPECGTSIRPGDPVNHPATIVAN